MTGTHTTADPAPTDRTVPGRWGPLHQRNFRWLVTGATVNSLGGSITPVALAFAVLDLGGSATQLGMVVGAYALAEVLTTLFGGVLGDRLPRQVMMEGSSAASALIQGFVAASLIGHWSSVTLLALTGLLGGAVSALSGPSSSAMTPLTVPAEQLSAAISLRRLSSNAAMIVGFGLAGVLVATIGSGWSIAIDAATYAVAALCFSLLRVPQVTAPDSESLLRGLRTGAAEVLRHTWLWLLIGQALLYHLFFGGAQAVLGPIVVGDAFGRAAWGWAMSALMVGFVAGGLVTLRWRPHRALLTGTVCLSLTACFPLAMAWSPGVVGVLVGAFLHGLGLEIFSVWWDLSIQQSVPPEKLARVYSFDIVGSFVARPLGLALVGPVSEAIGFHRWLVIVGAVMGGSSLLAACTSDVRRLVRRD
ncbi:Major facilitator superfamily MFS_1 [Nostocoides japonicum T1-X7]|uniref:Major facilitator superfamily MFS_1 n=1 Tax=Nostocoides japonicum T1-X7 TaxID=1194083 RepID=A0A077M4M6_9MICO|nr:MFS transporter [Tetrasphaera japonica]CCH80047.1 Major facilitator superfamily MFS_1 [Tetrasphaera japonica T1-X7]